MKESNPDMLLMIAMGDAYGAGVEYIEKSPLIMDSQIAKALEFKSYLQHPFHTGIKPGQYTDDTEMSVANARVLIENDYPFTKLQFADAYLREFNYGGKRDGYARGFQKFLLSIESGQEFIDKIKPESDKNGAAMRSVPFGVMGSIEDMLEAVTLQASLTHNTAAGLFSARAVALMSHFALYSDQSFADLTEFILAFLPREDWRKYANVFCEPWDGGPVDDRPNCPVSITTVHAVVDVLKRCDNLMEAMRQMILWKGDTDSVASIAWGILSARRKTEELPAFLYRDLELGNAETGVPYLAKIGRELTDKYWWK